MMQSFRDGTDFLLAIAAMACNKTIDRVTDVERTKVKRLVYGLMYGMGTLRLAEQLQIGKAEAERWKNMFFSKVFLLLHFFLSSL
jgi:DNA polymerase-1